MIQQKYCSLEVFIVMESNAKDKPGESAEMKPEKPKPQIGKIKNL